MAWWAPKAVECAERSIGVKEEKPNWGRWVAQYLAFIGLFRPAPWCAAFVAYKVHQGAREAGEKSAWPKTGYVQSLFNWAKKKGIASTHPRENTVFVIWYPSLRRYGHTGFIRAVDVKGIDKGVWVQTIEGNTNVAGGREGNVVGAHWRRWNVETMRCIEII